MSDLIRFGTLHACRRFLAQLNPKTCNAQPAGLLHAAEGSLETWQHGESSFRYVELLRHCTRLPRSKTIGQKALRTLLKERLIVQSMLVHSVKASMRRNASEQRKPLSKAAAICKCIRSSLAR